MMDTKYDADTKIADSSRQFEMLKAGFEAEVNTKVMGLKVSFSVIALAVDFSSDILCYRGFFKIFLKFFLFIHLLTPCRSPSCYLLLLQYYWKIVSHFASTRKATKLLKISSVQQNYSISHLLGTVTTQ